MEIQRYLFQIFWDAGVEENNIGGDQKVVCGICRKPISGPAYKHRYTHLFFHLSCLNLPTNYKALIFHFTSGHRRLIFTEEVKNDGKEEEVVCFGCEKPVLGPGYKCSTSSEGNLLLHRSCFELPPQIQQHPFHPNHTLVSEKPTFKFGQEKPEKKYCNACGINCNRYAFYGCSECDINLDIACATSHSRINNIDDCQHSFISFFKQIQFTCEACGEEGKELASQCSICQLLIHGKCARFSRIIRIARHDHSLVLTYNSLQIPQLKEHLDKSIFCKLFCEKVKTEYAAYYCRECGYVAHLACAFEDEVSANLELLPEEPDDFAADVMEVEGTGQIQHFSHQHDLILSSEELRDEKLCDDCTGLISTPFYRCAQSNLFLHSRCAQLPRKKKHQLHQHQLTLISQAPKFYRLFSCDACDRLSNGFAYTCDTCAFYLDLQCYSISETLKHEGHQHSLFLAVNSNRRCHVCNCTSNKKPGVFVCISCDFALGLECATLLLVAKHKYNDHLLKLTYIAEDYCEKSYCLICEEERDPNH